MTEPWFWRERSKTADVIKTALTPASLIYAAGQSLRRRFANPYRSTLPVICVGNATVGGVGKTPFAIMLGELLRESGKRVVYLTRGYRGNLAGPLLVNHEQHSAIEVGDEALLLSRTAPTIKSQNKAAGLRFAERQRYDIVILDDGFQNPSIVKDFNILLIDAHRYDHDAATFPAGPLRESYGSARERADLVVAIGERTPPDWAMMSAWLEPHDAPPPQPCIAVTGIGNPDRFFKTLEARGFKLIEKIAFPDHHQFTGQEIDRLKSIAGKRSVKLIMTEKDVTRLQKVDRDDILVLPVKMHCNAPDVLTNSIVSVISAHASAVGKQS